MPAVTVVEAPSQAVYYSGQMVVTSTTCTTDSNAYLLLTVSNDGQIFSYPVNGTSCSYVRAPAIVTTSTLPFIYQATSTGSTTVSTYVNGSTLTYFVSSPVYAPHTPEEQARLAKQRAIDAKLQAYRRETQVGLARGAIKRALKLMDNVGFGNDVRVFLGGDTVEVCHPDSMFKFLLSKSHHSVIDRTIKPGYSTPYKLQLYTKTDVHVADLCVYMQDTPMLDQVLAVSMFIQSGDEEHILEKANWSSVIRDPVMREAIRLHAPSLSNKFR